MATETRHTPVLTLILAVVVLIAAGAAFVEWGGVAFDSDVRAIYAATRGWVMGVSPWDEVGQAELLTRELGHPRTVLPFGYPPWFVLTTLPMGWLDYPRAERLFVLYNLAWFVFGTVALTVDADRREATRTLVLVGLYTPLVGLIAIGQMTLPVFTGATLALFGLRNRRPWLLALAALLLSFKWHIGAIPGLAFLVLLARQPDLLRRTLGPLIATFAMASLLGLLLDPAWPVVYLRSVLALSGADVNQVCDTCSSLAWTVSTRAPISTSLAGAALLILGAVAMARRGLTRDAPAFIAAGIALTLLCLPYVRNYDYTILALSLVIAARRHRAPWELAIVWAAWLVPLSLLLLPRGFADEVLGGSALAVFILLLVQGPRPSAQTSQPEAQRP